MNSDMTFETKITIKPIHGKDKNKNKLISLLVGSLTNGFYNVTVHPILYYVYKTQYVIPEGITVLQGYPLQLDDHQEIDFEKTLKAIEDSIEVINISNSEIEAYMISISDIDHISLKYGKHKIMVKHYKETIDMPVALNCSVSVYSIINDRERQNKKLKIDKMDLDYNWYCNVSPLDISKLQIKQD